MSGADHSAGRAATARPSITRLTPQTIVRLSWIGAGAAGICVAGTAMRSMLSDQGTPFVAAVGAGLIVGGIVGCAAMVVIFRGLFIVAGVARSSAAHTSIFTRRRQLVVGDLRLATALGLISSRSPAGMSVPSPS